MIYVLPVNPDYSIPPPSGNFYTDLAFFEELLEQQKTQAANNETFDLELSNKIFSALKNLIDTYGTTNANELNPMLTELNPYLTELHHNTVAATYVGTYNDPEATGTAAEKKAAALTAAEAEIARFTAMFNIPAETEPADTSDPLNDFKKAVYNYKPIDLQNEYDDHFSDFGTFSTTDIAPEIDHVNTTIDAINLERAEHLLAEYKINYSTGNDFILSTTQMEALKDLVAADASTTDIATKLHTYYAQYVVDDFNTLYNASLDTSESLANTSSLVATIAARGDIYANLHSAHATVILSNYNTLHESSLTLSTQALADLIAIISAEGDTSAAQTTLLNDQYAQSLVAVYNTKYNTNLNIDDHKTALLTMITSTTTAETKETFLQSYLNREYADVLIANYKYTHATLQSLTLLQTQIDTFITNVVSLDPTTDFADLNAYITATNTFLRDAYSEVIITSYTTTADGSVWTNDTLPVLTASQKDALIDTAITNIETFLSDTFAAPMISDYIANHTTNGLPTLTLQEKKNLIAKTAEEKATFLTDTYAAKIIANYKATPSTWYGTYNLPNIDQTELIASSDKTTFLNTAYANSLIENYDSINSLDDAPELMYKINDAREPEHILKDYLNAQNILNAYNTAHESDTGFVALTFATAPQLMDKTEITSTYANLTPYLDAQVLLNNYNASLIAEGKTALTLTPTQMDTLIAAPDQTAYLKCSYLVQVYNAVPKHSGADLALDNTLLTKEAEGKSNTELNAYLDTLFADKILAGYTYGTITLTYDEKVALIATDLSDITNTLHKIYAQTLIDNYGPANTDNYTLTLTDPQKINLIKNNADTTARNAVLDQIYADALVADYKTSTGVTLTLTTAEKSELITSDAFKNQKIAYLDAKRFLQSYNTNYYDLNLNSTQMADLITSTDKTTFLHKAYITNVLIPQYKSSHPSASLTLTETQTTALNTLINSLADDIGRKEDITADLDTFYAEVFLVNYNATYPLTLTADQTATFNQMFANKNSITLLNNFLNPIHADQNIFDTYIRLTSADLTTQQIADLIALTEATDRTAFLNTIYVDKNIFNTYIRLTSADLTTQQIADLIVNSNRTAFLNRIFYNKTWSTTYSHYSDITLDDNQIANLLTAPNSNDFLNKIYVDQNIFNTYGRLTSAELTKDQIAALIVDPDQTAFLNKIYVDKNIFNTYPSTLLTSAELTKDQIAALIVDPDQTAFLNKIYVDKNIFNTYPSTLLTSAELTKDQITTLINQTATTGITVEQARTTYLNELYTDKQLTILKTRDDGKYNNVTLTTANLSPEEQAFLRTLDSEQDRAAYLLLKDYNFNNPTTPPLTWESLTATEKADLLAISTEPARQAFLELELYNTQHPTAPINWDAIKDNSTAITFLTNTTKTAEEREAYLILQYYNVTHSGAMITWETAEVDGGLSAADKTFLLAATTTEQERQVYLELKYYNTKTNTNANFILTNISIADYLANTTNEAREAYLNKLYATPLVNAYGANHRNNPTIDELTPAQIAGLTGIDPTDTAAINYYLDTQYIAAQLEKYNTVTQPGAGLTEADIDRSDVINKADDWGTYPLISYLNTCYVNVLLITFNATVETPLTTADISSADLLKEAATGGTAATTYLNTQYDNKTQDYVTTLLSTFNVGRTPALTLNLTQSDALMALTETPGTNTVEQARTAYLELQYYNTITNTNSALTMTDIDIAAFTAATTAADKTAYFNKLYVKPWVDAYQAVHPNAPTLAELSATQVTNLISQTDETARTAYLDTQYILAQLHTYNTATQPGAGLTEADINGAALITAADAGTIDTHLNTLYVGILLDAYNSNPNIPALTTADISASDLLTASASGEATKTTYLNSRYETKLLAAFNAGRAADAQLASLSPAQITELRSSTMVAFQQTAYLEIIYYNNNHPNAQINWDAIKDNSTAITFLTDTTKAAADRTAYLDITYYNLNHNVTITWAQLEAASGGIAAFTILASDQDKQAYLAMINYNQQPTTTTALVWGDLTAENKADLLGITSGTDRQVYLLLETYNTLHPTAPINWSQLSAADKTAIAGLNLEHDQQAYLAMTYYNLQPTTTPLVWGNLTAENKADLLGITTSSNRQAFIELDLYNTQHPTALISWDNVLTDSAAITFLTDIVNTAQYKQAYLELKYYNSTHADSTITWADFSSIAADITTLTEYATTQEKQAYLELKYYQTVTRPGITLTLTPMEKLALTNQYTAIANKTAFLDSLYAESLISAYNIANNKSLSIGALTRAQISTLVATPANANTYLNDIYSNSFEGTIQHLRDLFDQQTATFDATLASNIFTAINDLNNNFGIDLTQLQTFQQARQKLIDAWNGIPVNIAGGYSPAYVMQCISEYNALVPSENAIPTTVPWDVPALQLITTPGSAAYIKTEQDMYAHAINSTPTEKQDILRTLFNDANVYLTTIARLYLVSAVQPSDSVAEATTKIQAALDALNSSTEPALADPLYAFKAMLFKLNINQEFFNNFSMESRNAFTSVLSTVSTELSEILLNPVNSIYDQQSTQNFLNALVALRTFKSSPDYNTVFKTEYENLLTTLAAGVGWSTSSITAIEGMIDVAIAEPLSDFQHTRNHIAYSLITVNGGTLRTNLQTLITTATTTLNNPNAADYLATLPSISTTEVSRKTAITNLQLTQHLTELKNLLLEQQSKNYFDLELSDKIFNLVKTLHDTYGANSPHTAKLNTIFTELNSYLTVLFKNHVAHAYATNLASTSDTTSAYQAATAKITELQGKCPTNLSAIASYNLDQFKADYPTPLTLSSLLTLSSSEIGAVIAATVNVISIEITTLTPMGPLDVTADIQTLSDLITAMKDSNTFDAAQAEEILNYVRILNDKYATSYTAEFKAAIDKFEPVLNAIYQNFLATVYISAAENYNLSEADKTAYDTAIALITTREGELATAYTEWQDAIANEAAKKIFYDEHIGNYTSLQAQLTSTINLYNAANSAFRATNNSDFYSTAHGFINGVEGNYMNYQWEAERTRLGTLKDYTIPNQINAIAHYITDYTTAQATTISKKTYHDETAVPALQAAKDALKNIEVEKIRVIGLAAMNSKITEYQIKFNATAAPSATDVLYGFRNTVFQNDATGIFTKYQSVLSDTTTFTANAVKEISDAVAIMNATAVAAPEVNFRKALLQFESILSEMQNSLEFDYTKTMTFFTTLDQLNQKFADTHATELKQIFDTFDIPVTVPPTVTAGWETREGYLVQLAESLIGYDYVTKGVTAAKATLTSLQTTFYTNTTGTAADNLAKFRSVIAYFDIDQISTNKMVWLKSAYTNIGSAVQNKETTVKAVALGLTTTAAAATLPNTIKTLYDIVMNQISDQTVSLGSSKKLTDLFGVIFQKGNDLQNEIASLGDLLGLLSQGNGIISKITTGLDDFVTFVKDMIKAQPDPNNHNYQNALSPASKQLMVTKLHAIFDPLYGNASKDEMSLRVMSENYGKIFPGLKDKYDEFIKHLDTMFAPNPAPSSDYRYLNKGGTWFLEQLANNRPAPTTYDGNATTPTDDTNYFFMMTRLFTNVPATPEMNAGVDRLITDTNAVGSYFNSQNTKVQLEVQTITTMSNELLVFLKTAWQTLFDMIKKMVDNMNR